MDNYRRCIKIKDRLQDKIFCGNNITVIESYEDFTVYKMEDAKGEGTMTCYNVFPGIDLIYNDFHMESCISEFQKKVEMIGIDHCREGRIEWEFKNNSYMYLQEGDMQINTRDHHATSLKICFKGVYGTSIYAYMRSYRMHAAAVMLRETNESIISIAGKVGYTNPSKFAAAFKEIMGMTPAKYQKHFV